MNGCCRVIAMTVAVFGSVSFADADIWTLKCRFPQGGRPWRCFQDVDRIIDISEDGGIAFDIVCSDVTRLYGINVHLGRGNIWISTPVDDGLQSGVTQRVYVARGDWDMKTLPGRKLNDWTGFTQFRFGASRATDEAFETEVSVSNLEIFHGPKPQRAVSHDPRLSLRPGERRLAWCHRAWGMSEKTVWDATVRELKSCGFTDVIPNMCRPGGAYYVSTVLPIMPYVSEHGDQLEACLQACRKYGLKCHAWKVCWYIGTVYAEGYLDSMKRAGRLAQFADGTFSKWLCPTHPDNRQAEISAMVELAGKGVDGIHFDYIRYGGPDMCFCERCLRLFKERSDFSGNWADCSDDWVRRWDDFRCENITSVVRETAEIVRRLYPRVEISAAVLPRGREVDRAFNAQEWGRWCRERYVDFVCPMDGVDSFSFFRRCLERNRAESGTFAKCYPGIYYSTWHNKDRNLRRQQLIEQIEAVRAAGFDGFAIFDYTPPTASALKQEFSE